MLIRKNIIYLRKKRMISRYKLAKDLGVNESLLRKIESGITENPQINTIVKVCTYFEITLDDLVNKDLERGIGE